MPWYCHKLRFVWIFAVAIALMALFLAGQPAFMSRAAPANVQPQATPSITNADGLRTVTMENAEGKVIVKVPDDIRTGDKISGTMTVEPKGSTKEEQERNMAAMRARMIRLMLSRASSKSGTAGSNSPVVLTVPLTGDSSTVTTSPVTGDKTRIEFNVVSPGGKAPHDDAASKPEMGRVTIPIDQPPPSTPQTEPPAKKPPGLAFFRPAAYIVSRSSGNPAPFVIPPLGQFGHPIQIRGQFDGDSSNTKVSLTAAKTAETALEVIAESPRKTIVENPSTTAGPSRVAVNEGTSQTEGPFRNLNVEVTAPKSTLRRGESTTLRVEVRGLEGLSDPVSLTLTASGVITMEGGAVQPLTISPSQVGRGGSYVIKRKITGIQAGGWAAAAIVIIY